jgi:ABC-type molybdate transport system substrate-binding protein
MAAIADGQRCRLFAAAEKDYLISASNVSDRQWKITLVCLVMIWVEALSAGLVAVWLVVAVAAGAEHVALSFFDFHWVR